MTAITCSACGEIVHQCDESHDYKSALWLLRAHHWERHGGAPPEGLP